MISVYPGVYRPQRQWIWSFVIYFERREIRFDVSPGHDRVTGVACVVEHETNVRWQMDLIQASCFIQDRFLFDPEVNTSHKYNENCFAIITWSDWVWLSILFHLDKAIAKEVLLVAPSRFKRTEVRAASFIIMVRVFEPFHAWNHFDPIFTKIFQIVTNQKI